MYGVSDDRCVVLWLFGSNMVGLMLLLLVPWFLSFVAMLGLCCFLRVSVTGWTRPTPLINPHEQQPAIQATKTFKKHFGAGDTISDHDKPTQKAHSLNTAEPSTQANDCRCFRSWVFLGGARHLELSPCDTRQCAYHMNLSSCNTCNTRFGHNQSHVTTSLSTGRGPVSCVQLSEEGFQVVYPCGLWSWSSRVGYG